MGSKPAGASSAGLARKESDRADENRPSGDAQIARLAQLGQRLSGPQSEFGVWAEFGHEEVVVRVEPLGHFQRCHPIGSACHGEVQLEVSIDGAWRNRGFVPGWNRAEQDGSVQHVVVQGEVVDGNFVESRLGERLPGVPT